MHSAGSDVSTVNIHRLRALYLLPSDHPAADAVRSKLDSIANRSLRDAVAQVLSRTCTDSAADVWLIRSLTLNLDFNLDSSDDKLADIWAQQLADSLVKVFEHNSEANQVLHFP